MHDARLRHLWTFRRRKRARGLRPKTPWVLASLFDLQAREGHWEEAQRTLAEASRRKAIPADDVFREIEARRR